MSRKRTKRKVVYSTEINPIVHAIAGARLLPLEVLNKLRMTELGALQEFATGTAGQPDWKVLADMLNISEYLARNKVGPEALVSNLAAQGVLRAIPLEGPYAVTPEQLDTLRHAYEYADLQRSSISLTQMERAIEAVTAQYKAHNDRTRQK
jgi:hypothetical protein